jgi:outer membrane receptor for ferrienterochelin and colicins
LKTIIWFFIGFFISTGSFAQISGVVKDAENVPLPFATVTVLEDNTTVLTDENGKFTIQTKKNAVSLTISYLGYNDKTVVWKKGTTLDIKLENSSTLIDEVVISGTMKEVSKMKSAIPIEVYTPQFFKRNPTSNIFSAMENINGVRPQVNCNVCNTGDIHINGMEGPYTMVMIDGMPIVSALSSVYGLMGIPNSMVQRMEVVKGPASTLYGSEAVGGLINIITKSVDNAPKFSFDLSSSHYGDVNLDMGTKFQLGKAKSLLSANMFLLDHKWDINDDNFTDVTLQKRVSLFNKWEFPRGKDKISSLAIRYVWEDRWGGEMLWNKSFRGGDSVYGESIYTHRLELIGKYSLPVKENIAFSYSYNYHDQNSVYGNTFYAAKQHVGFGQLVWDKTWKYHDLIAGITARYTWFDDNTPVTADSENLSINRPDKVFLPGIFVQDEISFTKKQTLLAGMRYDYHPVHGNIYTPRLSYKWTPNENNTFRIGLGNGFRVANVFSEDHAALSGAREVILAEDLQPEKSYNANINHVTRFFPEFGFITMDFSAFYNYFTNRIIADFFKEDDKIFFENLNGYSINRGLALNAECNFESGWRFTLGGTYTDIFVIEDDIVTGQQTKERQALTPFFTGNAMLSYSIPKWKMTFDYTANVVSPMRLPIQENDFRSEYSPWYSLQNIQCTKTFSKGWEIYFGIKNLLNFIPADPIMRPFDPFDKQVDINNPNGYTFDPSYSYASLQGIRGFVGVRWDLY